MAPYAVNLITLGGTPWGGQRNSVEATRACYSGDSAGIAIKGRVHAEVVVLDTGKNDSESVLVSHALRGLRACHPLIGLVATIAG